MLLPTSEELEGPLEVGTVVDLVDTGTGTVSADVFAANGSTGAHN
jgi:hypothetical protein